MRNGQRKRGVRIAPGRTGNRVGAQGRDGDAGPLGTFRTIVRSAAFLFDIPPAAMRVVTFLGAPLRGKLHLPVQRDGARMLAMRRREVFTVYVPNARGPVFMVLIERTFGAEITTRTWDTIRKCARA